jgi:hypothetical protein
MNFQQTKRSGKCNVIESEAIVCSRKFADSFAVSAARNDEKFAFHREARTESDRNPFNNSHESIMTGKEEEEAKCHVPTTEFSI